MSTLFFYNKVTIVQITEDEVKSTKDYVVIKRFDFNEIHNEFRLYLHSAHQWRSFIHQEIYVLYLSRG